MLLQRYGAAQRSFGAAQGARGPATSRARMLSTRPAATATLFTPLALSSEQILRRQSSHIFKLDGVSTQQRLDIFEAPCQTDEESLRSMPGPATTALSSGLDFIDFVANMDAAEAHNRLQDAVTFRMLGCGAGALWRVEAATNGEQVSGVNIKKMKAFRDHVTRNLAPTIAHGFSTADATGCAAVPAAAAIFAIADPHENRGQPQQSLPQLQAPRGVASNVVSAGGLSGKYGASSLHKQQPRHQAPVAGTAPAHVPRLSSTAGLMFQSVAAPTATAAHEGRQAAAATVQEQVPHAEVTASGPGTPTASPSSPSSPFSSLTAVAAAALAAPARPPPANTVRNAAPVTRRRRGSRGGLLAGDGRRGAAAGDAPGAWL